jgi:hypothetical protein
VKLMDLWNLMGAISKRPMGGECAAQTATLSPATAGNRSGTSILDAPKRIRLRSCIPTTAWGVSSAAPSWNLEMPYLSLSHGFDTRCLDGLMMQPASPVHMKQVARLTGVL